MESQHRMQLLTTLLEEADHKTQALTHALGARERVEQGEQSTHGAPLTEEEQALKYEHDLWERAQIALTEARRVLEELAPLEKERGVSQEGAQHGTA